MRLLLIISFMFILSAQSNAQDTTFVRLEEHKILHRNLSKYYNTPALSTYDNPIDFTDLSINYASNQSDTYILQQGSGYNDFNININSYQRKKNNLNLWGSFQYNNVSIKDIIFNETLDYNYVYPYVMTDTVGGNLKEEHYKILGGLSKTYDRTTYAFETSFVGKQSVRSRDPRVNNISSNFNATFAVSHRINQDYSLGLALIGERYFQKSKIAFNSELGRPTVFHETGLGNYNKIFADTRDNAEYLGYNYGTTLSFVSINHIGWFAKADYLGTHVTKKITDVAYVINEANKHALGVDLGYKFGINTNTFLESGAYYRRNSIAGIEGKFDNKDSQAGLHKISDENLFNSSNQTIGGYISYQKIYPKTTVSTAIRAAYTDSKESYVLPIRQEKFQYLNFIGDIQLNQQIQKSLLLLNLKYSYTNPLSAEGNWTGLTYNSVRHQMLINNFDYRNTQVSLIAFSAKISFPVKKLQRMFFGAHVSYASAYNLKQFGMTSGFVF